MLWVANRTLSQVDWMSRITLDAAPELLRADLGRLRTRTGRRLHTLAEQTAILEAASMATVLSQDKGFVPNGASPSRIAIIRSCNPVQPPILPVQGASPTLASCTPRSVEWPEPSTIHIARTSRQKPAHLPPATSPPRCFHSSAPVGATCAILPPVAWHPRIRLPSANSSVAEGCR